jgi:ribosomal protein L11 methyltransferase
LDNRRRRYPALDIRPGPGPGGLLPFYDAVLVAIDDCSPFAVQEEHDHLRVIFTDEADRATAETMLADLGDLTHTSLAWVTDDDWATRSQADLRAVRAGQVIVAPPWDLPVSPSPSEIVVEVLPALGFGSGHHPTTRLALLGLQQLDLNGLEVLDLGTGSGVLAVAAVKLGAQRATGIDRDPDALQSARKTLNANGVEAKIELRESTVSEAKGSTVPVVAANLTGATLIRLAPIITPLVRPGGHLIMSGILAEEETAVAEAYRDDAHRIWRATEAEWVGLIYQRARKLTDLPRCIEEPTPP